MLEIFRKDNLIGLIALLGLILIPQIWVFTTVSEDEDEHDYIIFQDDFEDGEAGDWSINIPDEAPIGSNCRVEFYDDNYVLSSRGQTWTEVGDFTWTNYTFEVKFKFITSQGCAMINFRLGDPELRYFLQFWVGDLFLTKQYLEIYSEVKHTRLAIKTKTWYALKIVCIGNNIRVYVDDVLKLQYVDKENPHLNGRIGLETCADSQIHYDDVKVSTTYRLYVTHLIKKAQDAVNEAMIIDADTSEAEQRLAEAQAAFAEGSLSSAESLARGAINLARQAPVGPVSVDDLSTYSSEYDQHEVEVSGTIRDVRYEQGIYMFAIDDGTGLISAAFNGTLGDIRTDDKVNVAGVYDASTGTLEALNVSKLEAPLEGLFTFLLFKDDFEDGDLSGWMISVSPDVEGSQWKVEREGDNQVLSGKGDCWANTGDPEWTDYIFDVKVKVIRGNGEVSFRTTHQIYSPRRYILKFSTYDMSLFKGDVYLKEERHTELKRVSVDLDPDTWYGFKITCNGNNFMVYLDDVLKLDYTDNDEPFLTGMVVLASTSYGEGAISNIFFDDVKVSKVATTDDIDELIEYANSEIEEAKEINADVGSAELKLEQAKQALAQEEYQMVQYLVNDAVWLAKRASVGEISITNLKAIAIKCTGHTVELTGVVKSLEARMGVGYDFVLDDGTDSISVTYQGVLTDFGEDYQVKVTGIFDAPSGTVAASRVKTISGPSTPQPSGPLGLTWSIEQITTLITIGGAGAGIIGWMVRTHGTRKRKKILFKKLMDEIDDIYARFKMNARRCEAELHRLKDEVLDEFKEGTINENNYKTLERRIDDYMEEVKNQIERENNQPNT